MQGQRRCFVVTSGTSTRGSADRFCGWTDPPLSSLGRQELLARVQEFAAQETQLPRIWYVSDRRRAIETFEAITAGMHAPVVVLAEKLREIHFGMYENLTWEELPYDFQRQYESCLTQPMELAFPGGERFVDLCERVSSMALDILSYQDDSSNVGIVGHQGSTRLWYMMAAGLPPSAFFSDTPAQASARWLDLGPGHVAQWRRNYLTPRSLS